MAAHRTVIGPTTRVRGRVTGDGDLDVQGFVQGEISVGGDVTVDTQGMVDAGVSGKRVVVRGAIKGDVVGLEAVSIEDGARVVGDVHAPRVAIAPGALVRGLVETTGEMDSPAARAARPAAGARAHPATPSKMVASSPMRAAVASSPAATATVAVRPAPPKGAAGVATAPAPASEAYAAIRRPPPPVVPALKKARGQIAKRRER